jgi:phospholipid transport system substrate-binding protein
MLTRRSFLAPAAAFGIWLAAFPITPVFAQAKATPAKATPVSDPAAFVNGMIQQALAILRNKQITDAALQQQFKTMLDKNFDIPKIARFVLGRYWSTASDDDRNTFNGLFEQWIVRTYSARFKEYGGENIKVTGSRPESDTSSVVQSQLIHPDGSPPAAVDWHVNKGPDGFKVVDVEVEGVSMALTERDEFSAVIQRAGGDVASLNKALKDKLDSGVVDTAGSDTKSQ